MNRKQWVFISLVVVLTTSAVVEGLYFWFRLPSTPAAASLADILSAFLLALWVVCDSKDHPQVMRPFDYGYLVLTFSVPYLPYYLWRTRGAAGLLVFAGFLGLFAMGTLVQLAIYGLYSLRL